MTDEHLAQGRVYPPLSNIREVSTHLATRVVEYCYKEDIAGTYPEPADKEEFVRKHQYNDEYETFVPNTYAWPGMPA